MDLAALGGIVCRRCNKKGRFARRYKAPPPAFSPAGKSKGKRTRFMSTYGGKGGASPQGPQCPGCGKPGHTGNAGSCIQNWHRQRTRKECKAWMGKRKFHNWWCHPTMCHRGCQIIKVTVFIKISEKNFPAIRRNQNPEQIRFTR